MEPETPEGRALTTRLNGEAELLSAPDSSALTSKLERAWRIGHDRPLVESVCREFVGELTNTVARNPSDPRVLAAIDYIRQRIDTPISLPAIAKVAHLSPGRFRHLFVEDPGDLAEHEVALLEGPLGRVQLLAPQLRHLVALGAA